MEITCNRCKTEYEFDDALVSERGTTVRCTNCGEQFKVYRAGSAVPERWVVQRRDGRELVFTNLRDLQRAITNLQVGRHDTLTRDSSPARPLGSIAELEPFFLGRLAPAGTPATAQVDALPTRTEAGIAPREEVASRSGRTGRPPAEGPAAPAPPAAVVTSHRPLSSLADDVEASPIARTMVDPNASTAFGGGYGSGPLGDDIPRAGTTRMHPSYEPPPSDSYNPEQDWFGEPRFSTIPPARSRAIRWLVVLLLLGLLGVAGATVGRKYVAMVVRPAPAAPTTEARVENLLDEGDRALGDGDLETAKESYDKASALAEHDPRVLVDLARLDAARADSDWLKVRIVPANQPDIVDAAKRQAQQSARRALKFANQATDAAPDDPKTARTKIDALRLSGDLAGARLLVARVGSIATQPETAYVLAALDLAEESPSWPAVLDRLRTAAAGESNAGRPRGAYVYALARSGDLPLAKAELDKMATAARPYSLLTDLQAFILRSSAATGTDPDAGKREAGGATAAPEGARLEGEAGTYRALLQQAAQAASARKYDRAEQLYRAALAKSPGDTEALGGLGDLARARGNPSQARSYYEKLLSSNPHYVPAMAGLADIKWDAGDRGGAAKLYREVVDNGPDGPFAERAKDRLAQADAAPAPKPAKRAPDRTPAPTRPTDVPPEIDTSDLPGFKP